MRKLATLLTLAVLSSSLALAEEVTSRATSKDAEQLVHNAVAFLKKEGKEKALKVFSDPNGPFTFRDLYVFAIDFKGVVIAHGTKKELIGRNDFNIKDPTGKFFTREMIEIAKTKGSGWEEYQFVNPVSGKLETKVAYVQRVDDFFVACGAFRR